ncbi:MAG: hypothetical protein ACRCZ9_02350 [Fusobacteriaceae bacterium]
MEISLSDYYMELQRLNNKLYSSEFSIKSITKSCIGKYIFPIIKVSNATIFEISSSIAKQKLIRDQIGLINIVLKSRKNTFDRFFRREYEEKDLNELFLHFKIIAPKEFLDMIDRYNLVISKLNAKKSDKLAQLMDEFYNFVDLYNWEGNDHMLKNIEKEVALCNSGNPSEKLILSELHEEVHILNNKENLIGKSSVSKKEIDTPQAFNLSEMLEYSTGAGITAMINKTDQKRLSKFKPYSNLQKDVAIEILSLILPICSKQKYKIILNTINKIKQEEN